MREVAPFCRCGEFVAGVQHWRYAQKKAPENPGPQVWEETSEDAAKRRNASASKTEAGQVAVAQRDAGRSHQRAIDRSKQTGEERGVGRKPDSGSLGHGRGPFPGVRPAGRLVVWDQSMYTRYQRQQACLHSSNCVLQRNI